MPRSRCGVNGAWQQPKREGDSWRQFPNYKSAVAPQKGAHYSSEKISNNNNNDGDDDEKPHREITNFFHALFSLFCCCFLATFWVNNYAKYSYSWRRPSHLSVLSAVDPKHKELPRPGARLPSTGHHLLRSPRTTAGASVL